MKRFLSAALVAAGLLSASAAVAGYKYAYPALVDTVGRYAAGTMGGTRNSANAVEYIICSNVATNTGIRYAQCYAKNAAGVFGSCYTTDPAIIAVVSTLQGDSYFYFAWDAGGNCANVSVYNGSYPAPKQP